LYFLPYLQMSKNLRRDVALGEAPDPGILHNRKIIRMDQPCTSDGDGKKLFVYF